MQKTASFMQNKLVTPGVTTQSARVMNKRTLIAITVLALAGAFTLPAVRADDSAPKDKPVSKSALKKYDKDGDGQLNAEEEAAMKADREKAKEKRAEARKETLEHYDKNGNGKLDPDERAAMKADRDKAKEERAEKRKAKKEAKEKAEAEN